jgi:hypothetical protein
MYAVEENRGKQQEMEISGLIRKKNEAEEAARAVESEMNRRLQQAMVQQREKCFEVLSQSHSRFSHLMEVSSCETFRLGWEQALLDPSARTISGPDEYDALSKIESGNYDLEYYASKENLAVTFAEEYEDETENRGSESHASKSERPEVSSKDQADSKPKAVVSGEASGLEGCLEIPSSSGGFDDNITITFGTPILQSPDVQTLDFLEKVATPQSQLSKDSEPGASSIAGQGQQTKPS